MFRAGIVERIYNERVSARYWLKIMTSTNLLLARKEIPSRVKQYDRLVEKPVNIIHWLSSLFKTASVKETTVCYNWLPWK